MIITNEKPEDTFYIRATGKGKHTEVVFTFIPTYGYRDSTFSESFDLEDAKKVFEGLKWAIEDAERRALLPNDD